jgi:hypothetical protein
MTTVMASVLSVVVASLLIAGSFENAAKMQQAMAGNSNSLQSTNNNNNSTLNVGRPEKMTLSELSKPPVLSQKKQALEQDQEKTHLSPPIANIRSSY